MLAYVHLPYLHLREVVWSPLLRRETYTLHAVPFVKDIHRFPTAETSRVSYCINSGLYQHLPLYRGIKCKQWLCYTHEAKSYSVQTHWTLHFDYSCLYVLYLCCILSFSSLDKPQLQVLVVPQIWLQLHFQLQFFSLIGQKKEQNRV